MRVEEKLIIELCKKQKNKDSIKSYLGKKNFNTKYFLKIIDKHLVKASVLSELQKFKISHLLRKRLTAEAEKSIAEIIINKRILKKEQIKILNLLNVNKIESVVLKGLSLDFSGLRFTRDLDILVHENKLLDAIDTLKNIDYYYIGDSINHLLNSAEENNIALQLNWNNQFQLYNKTTGLLLELHTNLFERERVYNIKLDSLLNNINGFWSGRVWNSDLCSFELSTEDLLILMCMHCAIKRSPSSNKFVLRTLMDIDALAERKPDWNNLMHSVKTYKVSSLVNFSLLLSKKVLGTEIPFHVLEELKNDSTPKQCFLENIHLRSFQSLERSSIFFSNIYRVLAPFIYQSSLKLKLRNLLLIPIIFPPKWKMANIYHIKNSNPLIYLAYFLNPLRWIFLVSKNLFKK